VLPAFWWLYRLGAVALTPVGLFALALGVVSGSLNFAAYGVLLTTLWLGGAVSVWMARHLGVWVGDEGVQFRTFPRPRVTVPWDDVDGFEVLGGPPRRRYRLSGRVPSWPSCGAMKDRCSCLGCGDIRPEPGLVQVSTASLCAELPRKP
jgi:hypothetical protein